MRLGTFLCCILLVLQFDVPEGKKAHKGKLRKWQDPKQRTLTQKTLRQNILKLRTENKVSFNELENEDDGFHEHCTDIFKQKDLEAYLALDMVSEILGKFDALCPEGSVHPLAIVSFTEALLCGKSLHIAITKMMEVLYGQLEKECEDMPGFKSVFVFTNQENDIHHSVHLA